jgi:hypothetical protein
MKEVYYGENRETSGPGPGLAITIDHKGHQGHKVRSQKNSRFVIFFVTFVVFVVIVVKS